MASKQNGVLNQNKQDTENVVHLSTLSRRTVSDDVKNVLNDYLHQNCPNSPRKHDHFRFAKRLPIDSSRNAMIMTFFFDKSFL